MKGTVCSIFVTPERKAEPVAVPSVDAISTGFSGDYHSKFSNRRQILLLSASTLNAFDLQPGAIFENVVIDNIDVMVLKEGQKLRMGDALFEVTVPCEPCVQMEGVRPGLKAALKDKRGMFVIVVQPGIVRVGDEVELM
jgi:MOSC domain-containing protein YiiM